jgi:hypothetical protein
MIRPPLLAHLAALFALALAVAPARAAGPAPGGHGDAHGHGSDKSGPNIDALDAAKDLADKTLSGVAFIPQPNNASSLKTVMFQAYLRPDGSALVRAWDTAANRYTPTDTRPWRGERDQLCLTVPAFGLPEPLCIQLHSWGVAFAGTGVNVNAMVKGDVRTGAVMP